MMVAGAVRLRTMAQCPDVPAQIQPNQSSMDMMTAEEIRKKFNGFLEDAIENVVATYKTTKGRKDRSELRAIYEDLVKMDTQRAGFRRYIKLL